MGVFIVNSLLLLVNHVIGVINTIQRGIMMENRFILRSEYFHNFFSTQLRDLKDKQTKFMGFSFIFFSRLSK